MVGLSGPTKDIMNELLRLPPLPRGCLSVTLDVSSLYTNIPHEEVIAACEEFLIRREKQEPPTTDLCQLTQLVLTKNSFVLMKRIIYMSTALPWEHARMALSYANLFMGKLRSEFPQTQDKVPRVWWKYTDDIFAIWDHGEQFIKVFI